MNLSLNSSQSIAIVAVAAALVAGAYAVGRSSAPVTAPAVVAAAPESVTPALPLEPAASALPVESKPAEPAALPTPKPAPAPAPALKPVAKAKPAVEKVAEAPVVVAAAEPASQAKPLIASHEPVKPALCASCLRVLAVRSEERPGEASGLGVIGGAVIGGLLGSQVGGGSGKKLATIGGAVAGGYAGNEIEKRHKSGRLWIIKLEHGDGRTLSHQQASEPGVVAGDIVELRDGELHRH